MFLVDTCQTPKTKKNPAPPPKKETKKRKKKKNLTKTKQVFQVLAYLLLK